MSSTVIHNTTVNHSTMVIRRNGQTTAFDPQKIFIAISKAFLAVEGEHNQLSSHIHEMATQ